LRGLYSELSGTSFLAGKYFETSGPPTGFDRLDEFVGDVFFPHFSGETLMVVFEGNEFNLDLFPRGAARGLCR
jgi:hypothetical protein